MIWKTIRTNQICPVAGLAEVGEIETGGYLNHASTDVNNGFIEKEGHFVQSQYLEAEFILNGREYLIARDRWL